MLGGHESSGLGLKERLRLLMNKEPFLFFFEFFPFNLVSFLVSSWLSLGGSTFVFFWALSWWEHVDFSKLCITVDVVNLFSSKIRSRLSYTQL